MAGEYESLQKILSAINKKQDLNKDNIIQKIQEELNKQYQDLYEEWEKGGFDVNHRFGLGDLECLKPALLTIAALHGHANIVEVLLGAKANVNEKDISGCTALHYAALHGHANIVEVLLGAKANVNEKDYYYGTALHYVASKGNAEAAELLIKKGANVNAVDGFGKTPLDYAKSKNVLEVLLKAGGRSFVKAFNKGIATAVETALLGAAIAVVLFATETIAIPIAIAVVAVIAIALVVGGATYMMLKPSTKVDGVAVSMDRRQESYFIVGSLARDR